MVCRSVVVCAAVLLVACAGDSGRVLDSEAEPTSTNGSGGEGTGATDGGAITIGSGVTIHDPRFTITIGTVTIHDHDRSQTQSNIPILACFEVPLWMYLHALRAPME